MTKRVLQKLHAHPLHLTIIVLALTVVTAADWWLVQIPAAIVAVLASHEIWRDER